MVWSCLFNLTLFLTDRASLASDSPCHRGLCGWNGRCVEQKGKKKKESQHSPHTGLYVWLIEISPLLFIV